MFALRAVLVVFAACAAPVGDEAASQSAALSASDFVATDYALSGAGTVVPDMTGDGRFDVLSSDSRWTSGPSLLPSTPTGAFAGAVALSSVGRGARRPIVVDMDLDGQADIVDDAEVSLAVDAAAHVYSPFVRYLPLSAASLDVETVADFNGDGFPDLASAVYDAGSPTRSSLFVHTNDGSGGLALAVQLFNTSRAVAIASRDLDGDGDQDIVTATNDGAVCGNYCRRSSFEVYTQTSNAPAFSVATYTIDFQLQWSLEDEQVDKLILDHGIALADLNGDGILDLVAQRRTHIALTTQWGAPLGHKAVEALLVYRGRISPSGNWYVDVTPPNATIELGTQQQDPYVAGPVNVFAAGDADADGRVDLVVARRENWTLVDLRLVRNTGGWDFTKQDLGILPPHSVFEPTISTADLNADGALDIVVGSASIATVLMQVAPPPAPTGLTANAVAHDAVAVTWTDNSLDETEFAIERADSFFTGAFVEVARVPAGTTSHTDTPVSASTTYTYRVRALSALGESLSNTASATTPPVPRPAAPSGLVATAPYYDTVRLTWVDNSDDEAEFIIQRALSSALPVFAEVGRAAANATAFEDRTVSAATSYMYRVRAANVYGVSGYASASVTTPPAAPAPPGGGTRGQPVQRDVSDP